MTTHQETGIDLDPELMAYVDGQLSPDKVKAVEARLARDAEAREAVAQWRHFDNLLHDYAGTMDQSPANLKIAALERELAAKLKKQNRRALLIGGGWQRMAAGLVLFVAGWASHGIYTAGSDRMMANTMPYFVTPTLAGHAAHTLAAYEDTEFDGANMASALDWMSAKMQYKIESPKLDRLGYQVESARMIMVDDHPVAVFYYRNPENERVTVSLTPRHEDQSAYALRVVDVNEGVMAYWSSDALHYTIVANEPRGTITTLAAAVQD